MDPPPHNPPTAGEPAPRPPDEVPPTKPACPACGGHLVEIRGKLQCVRCHTICETCCEGGPG